MPEFSSSDQDPLFIRKYTNRRYYDSTRSCHVTLEDLHELVRQGRDVRVTDSKSGEDITAKVLTQIMLDLDPAKLQAMPVALLHELIRSNEEVFREFIDTYFHKSFEMFMASQRQFQSQMRRVMGLGGAAQEVPASPSPWAKMMAGPFWSGMWPAGGMADQHVRPADSESSSPNGKSGEGGEASLRSEVETLRQELEALRSAMGRPPEAEKAD